MASRMALRSGLNRPRIRTTFDVIVSMTWRIFLIVEEQVDELGDFRVVNCDYWGIRWCNNKARFGLFFQGEHPKLKGRIHSDL